MSGQGAGPRTTIAGPAITTLRETSKWLIVVWGAIAGALISSLSLSNLGTLELGWRLMVAVLGMGLALLGIAIIIKNATKVLTPSHFTLNKLVSNTNKYSTIIEFFDRENRLFLGYATSIKTLNSNLDEAVKTYSNADPFHRTKALEQLKNYRNLEDDILEIVNYLYVRERFKNLQRKLFCCGIVIFSGIVVFAIAGKTVKEADNSKALKIVGPPRNYNVQCVQSW